MVDAKKASVLIGSHTAGNFSKHERNIERSEYIVRGARGEERRHASRKRASAKQRRFRDLASGDRRISMVAVSEQLKMVTEADEGASGTNKKQAIAALYTVR